LVEPSHYLAVVRKHWIIIVTVTLLGMGAALGLSLREPKTYRSTTTVFLSLTQGESVSELVQGSTYAQNLVTSYKQIATEPVVLAPVIEKLGLRTTPGRLAGQIATDAPLDTVLITITATDTVPERAAAIANAVGEQLSTTVEELSPTGPGSKSFVRVTTVAPAQVPTYPFSPRKKLALAVGLALGLAAGVGLALLRELIDTRVRTAEDIAEITDKPVLGRITFSDNAQSNALLEEEFRYLRTNLMSVTVDERPRSVVVTSSSSGEGKTTVAINLALALAQSDLRVILVDADLRRPAVTRYLQI
jgi:capsular polysaccharide biosynthesis protein